MTLVKPYGATELLDACSKIVAGQQQRGWRWPWRCNLFASMLMMMHTCVRVSDASSMSGIPDEVRRNFSFDPTLLSGGTHAVEKTEQAYADADEYMKIKDDDEEEDIGSSSLSKELKQMVRIAPMDHAGT
jgi:hypothetical protein